MDEIITYDGPVELIPAQRPASSLQAVPQFDGDMFRRFIEYTDRKDTTIKGYLTYIRQFAKWLSDNGITQPQRDDVRAYRDHLASSGLSAGTQAQYLRAVKHFFKWTAAEGIYPNISENVHGAKVRQDIHRKDALERSAVSEIADSIDRSTEAGKRLYAMYMLCITGGLRTVELHRADVGDLKTVGHKTYLYIQGKGHDSKDAPILIIPEVYAAIQDYLNNRSTKPTAKSPLFTATGNRNKGGRIAATTISQMLKSAMVNAGYDSDRLTAHSLRHTSGTGAYKATGNIFLAQKHQRHVDVSTTQIYVHAEERDERNTEAQVYSYYFDKDNDQGSERDKAMKILSTLEQSKVHLALDFLTSLKGA